NGRNPPGEDPGRATRWAGRPPAPARRRARAARARRRRSPAPPARLWAARARRTAARPGRAAGSGCQRSRDLTSGRHQIQHLLTPLGPGVELVGLVTVGPALPGGVALTGEPE